jgi:hypothetical protein
MTREEAILGLQGHFDIRDLVCPHTYNAFGQRSWQFLSTELLITILIVRENILKTGMIANNWRAGGSFSQRGLRCNLCQIVKDKTDVWDIYLSGHCLGAAIDFDAIGMAAEEARGIIRENAILLPNPIRLEVGPAINWVHMDVFNYMNGKIINEFTA